MSSMSAMLAGALNDLARRTICMFGRALTAASVGPGVSAAGSGTQSPTSPPAASRAHASSSMPSPVQWLTVTSASPSAHLIGHETNNAVSDATSLPTPPNLPSEHNHRL